MTNHAPRASGPGVRRLAGGETIEGRFTQVTRGQGGPTSTCDNLELEQTNGKINQGTMMLSMCTYVCDVGSD